MSNFKPSNKASPCPCCSDSGGKCRTIKASFELPTTSSKSTLDTEMVLCMREREDIQNYTYIGETKDGNWGKYISNELSKTYKEEWGRHYGKGNSHNMLSDNKARAERIAQRTQQRQERIARMQKARNSHQRALLPEIERDCEIRKVLDSLTISDRDYKDLIERGFDHEEIFDNQYKTIQPEQPLAEKTSHLLAGITADGMSLNNRISGMILPIKNHRGRYIGWQHRPHQTNDKGAKYYWAKTKVNNRDYDITSHVKETLELPLAYCNPNSGNIIARNIGLTEGIGFKAQLAANRHQQIIIGASGGQFTASTQSFLKYLEFASKQLDGSKNVVFYPDAGAVKNPLVLRAYSRTTDLLAREGYQVKFAWWDQIDKSVGDIDEIKHDRFSLISPKEFYTLGKQYSDWHPDNSVEIISFLQNPQLNEIKIAEKFANKLRDLENKSSLKEMISDFKNRYSDRFGSIKRLAWKQLESKVQKRITATLSEEVQQLRVSKIAPIIADYLELNQKCRVENANTIVEYKPEQKTLTYIDKNDKSEFLIASLSNNNSWKDRGSNISQRKEDYFINEVRNKIARLKLNINSKRSRLR